MTNPANLAKIARADTSVFEQMGMVAGYSQLTSDYTLGLADRGWMLESNSANQITVTIPNEASVNFPVNSLIHFHRFGGGDLVFAPDTAVTLYSAAGFRKISAQYQTATLWKRGHDVWLLSGVLKA